jgi:DNA-binding LytR/AlgR family response regulator
LNVQFSRKSSKKRTQIKASAYFEKLNQSDDPGTKDSEKTASDYIFLKEEYQLVKVLLKEIAYVEAYKDYVKVHLTSKPNPILSLTSLKSMEELLPSDQFMRVHRSFIVALDHIESVSKNVINIGNQSIAVGDNYKDPFLEFMSGWMS